MTPDWLYGTFEEALQAVAEQAVLVKVAAETPSSGFDWKAILADPRIQAGLLGAGVGGVGGALMSREHKGRGALLGALGGAGLGAGVAHLSQGGQKGPQVDREKAHAAIAKSQGARQTLGVLGADEGRVNKAVKNQQSGKSTEKQTAREIKRSVPGAFTQIRHLPSAFGTAVSQGRADDAADQVDVAGLKGLLPTSSHFSPVAAGAGAAANYGLRNSETFKNWQLRGDLKHMMGNDAAKATMTPEFQKKIQNEFIGHANPAMSTIELNKLREAQRAYSSRYRKVTGGTIPLLAGVAPLAMKEWLSGSGYRSGDQPAHDLAGATSVLSGKA